MMRVVLFFALTAIVSLFCASNIFAVSLSLDSIPSKITTSEFEIAVSITGAKPATNYLKLLMYKEGTHEYVTKTWNGHDWYMGSNGKEYAPVTISGKTVSAPLKAQIVPQIENGEYILSVRRFTASGNEASDSVTPATVLVDLPTASPTHTPEPKMLTPLPIDTPEPTVLATETPWVEPVQLSPLPIVLAAKSEVVPTSTDAPQEVFESDANISQFWVGVLFLIGGLGCIVWGGYSIFKNT